jgi:hypothetical protein
MGCRLQEGTCVMAAQWIPLPFPQCPTCSRKWASSFHKSCQSNQPIQVEIESLWAHCPTCQHQWPVDDTTFFCSCGREFSASEVSDALTAAELIRARLLSKIESLTGADRRITELSSSSLSDWLRSVSFSVGEAAGQAVLAFRKWLSDMFG